MKHIATPIQAQGNIGSGRNAMILLKHKILKSILLRRTKKGRAADLALPPRMVCFISSYYSMQVHFDIIFAVVSHAILLFH